MLSNKKLATLITSLVISNALVTNVNAKAPSNEQWQAFNLAVVAEHITPNYQQLTVESKNLSDNINSYCETREQGAAADKSLTQARMQFKKALQAWQKIQHIQFGPVTLLMRNFSLQYWPDKKNLGGRQLSTILKKQSEQGAESYDSEFFAKASVAVKGYPALERMLFDKKLMTQLDTNESYCPLMQAISLHVYQNTKAITAEWRDELQNYSQYSEDDVYESSLEAATEILKALVEPLEAISDAKIALPLGSVLSKMRWRRSESWRSEQSVENVRSNVVALKHLYSGVKAINVKQLLIQSGEDELATKIEEQFNEVLTLLSQAAEPLNMTYQQADFDKLDHIKVKLKRLSDSLLASMKPLQVNLGFNRRDGD